MDIQLIELKGLTVNNKGAAYLCICAEDITDYVLYIKSTQIQIKTDGKNPELRIKLSEEIVGHWSSNLHLKLFNLCQNIVNFIHHLKENFNFIETRNQVSKVLNFQMYGVVAFHITISENHSAKVSVSEYYAKNIPVIELCLINCVLLLYFV